MTTSEFRKAPYGQHRFMLYIVYACGMDLQFEKYCLARVSRSDVGAVFTQTVASRSLWLFAWPINHSDLNAIYWHV